MARKSKDSSAANVDVGVSARAEISLRGEIPKNSLGRLVDSITDIFRPFSERRGLQADQIRLQREEVAIEIAKRARAKLAIQEMRVNPVDNKILIPLIEKCSLERVDDEEMIDRWSSLLANAATDHKIEPRYVQILSEVTARQAKIFENIILNDPEIFDPPDRIFEDASALFDTPRVREQINSLFRDRKSRMDPEIIFEKIIKILNQPGCDLIDIVFFEPDDQMYSLSDSVWAYEKYKKLELDMEIIASLGLIKRVTMFNMTKFKEEIQIYYYHATELGVEFFKAVDRRKRIAAKP